jgi:Domain of unknown function (DUF1918)
MRAHVGDRLVLGDDRIGVVIGVPSDDGGPPYIVKWLRDGHIAMVTPDQYSRLVPGQRPAQTAHSNGKAGGTPSGGRE